MAERDMRSDGGRDGRGTRPRVLLVSTNRERAPFPVLPNGLACVASALDGAGHDVRLVDLCFAPDAERAAREAAAAWRPDVIGVSVRNIDNSDTIALRHYTPEAAAVLGALRKGAPQAAVVAGGVARGRDGIPGETEIEEANVVPGRIQG